MPKRTPMTTGPKNVSKLLWQAIEGLAQRKGEEALSKLKRTTSHRRMELALELTAPVLSSWEMPADGTRHHAERSVGWMEILEIETGLGKPISGPTGDTIMPREDVWQSMDILGKWVLKELAAASPEATAFIRGSSPSGPLGRRSYNPCRPEMRQL